MYDPQFPFSDGFPELNNPAFWTDVARQVDTTTLLHPEDALLMSGPLPSTSARMDTDRLQIRQPETTALIPISSMPGLRASPDGLAISGEARKHSLLLPVGFIGLALLLLFMVIGTHAGSSKQNTSAPPTSPAYSGTDYRAMARADAEEFGISPDLFERQINQESGFNPKSLSPAGAEGIAQFMPYTAKGLGIDPWNPAQALKAAAKLMAAYYQTYGSYQMALAAYNCGPQCLADARKLGGSSWGCYLPSETSAYIYAIMNVKVC